MSYKLLNLYKTELSKRKLILDQMIKSNFKRTQISFTAIMSVLIILIFDFFHPPFFHPPFLYFDISLIIILFIASYIIFLKEYQKESMRVINSTGKNDYSELRIEGLKNYFISNGIDYNTEKIELLIKMIEKQSNELNTNFFVGGNAMITIMASFLTSTIVSVLNKYITNIGTALIISTFIMLILYFVFFLFFFTKRTNKLLVS
ncbi:hypothetical protein [Paenibacillus sp. WLX2291]|uniref:hypothetical protein n=1 Tax=Paenibacillus sp. WLX2291 TaxID=3296934 RepID=UPI003983FB03